MIRLLDYVRTNTRNPRPNITFAEIGKRLGASSATMTNWKSRGISRDGALQAEREFGCSGSWLMSGEGSPEVGARLVPSTRPTLTDAVVAIAKALQDVPDDALDTIAANMSAWVKAKGAQPWSGALVTLLEGLAGPRHTR
jgi:hypothetical protein